jgi:hypothetical protein
MAEGRSVPEHLNAFQVITTQLDAFKFNLDDEMKALILLSSLPRSWSLAVIGSMNPFPWSGTASSMKTSEVSALAFGPKHGVENRGGRNSVNNDFCRIIFIVEKIRSHIQRFFISHLSYHLKSPIFDVLNVRDIG